MTKKLIAYFSASGVTKNAAEKLSKIDDDDLFEITPETAYTDADLDWQDQNSRTTNEKEDKSIRPAIKNTIDVSEYDTIVLGFPVWWYTYPNIISTFLESTDFSDNSIITFVTSGGTGVTGPVNDLEKAYPEISWKQGKRLTGSESQEELKEFINQ
ncbi:flavodoxin [uncultured Methanosphaera sp.]|uniref:flavodoxin n=1 Tax=uncultured Methanosphaera sp. TaxID=262501 RepID=UPI000DC3042D|nr:flavodoxin [uncultured Methanosphaera sp.]RAP43554.1 MAG: flavodoxin [Methanosphaera sp. SHI1033]